MSRPQLSRPSIAGGAPAFQFEDEVYILDRTRGRKIPKGFWYWFALAHLLVSIDRIIGAPQSGPPRPLAAALLVCTGTFVQ